MRMISPSSENTEHHPTASRFFFITMFLSRSNTNDSNYL